MTDWFQNGEGIVSVAVDDRAYQYGDGLFETLAIRDGTPRLWEYHLRRLERGCQRLDMEMPAADELMSGVLDAVARSNVPANYCIAKIIVSSGSGLRGYGRKRVVRPSVVYGVFVSVPPPLAAYRNGIDTQLCETRLARGSSFAGLKTLNRLEQVLARSELDTRSFVEGFTLDTADNLICGTMSNVFIVKKGIISTPYLTHCGVAGVMRQHVIDTLAEHRFPVVEAAIPVSELQTVDEVFISNSQFGIMPVRTCGDLAWAVGKVTRNAMSLLADSGIVECRS